MINEKQSTEIRKKQIIDVCLDIISLEGLGSLSIAEVARRMGMANSALYRHFRDKDEIILAIVEEIGSRIQQDIRIADVTGQDSLDKLEIIIKKEFYAQRERRAFQMIVFSDTIIQNKDGKFNKAKDIFEQFAGAAIRIFEEGQDLGTIRDDIPAKTLMLMFIGIFLPATSMHIIAKKSFDMKQHIEEAWPAFKEMVNKK